MNTIFEAEKLDLYSQQEYEREQERMHQIHTLIEAHRILLTLGQQGHLPTAATGMAVLQEAEELLHEQPC